MSKEREERIRSLIGDAVQFDGDPLTFLAARIVDLEDDLRIQKAVTQSYENELRRRRGVR